MGVRVLFVGHMARIKSVPTREKGPSMTPTVAPSADCRARVSCAQPHTAHADSHEAHRWRSKLSSDCDTALAALDRVVGRHGRMQLTTPPAEVVARMKRIIVARKRGEAPELIDSWQPSHAEKTAGLIRAAEFQIWIDWLVRDGQLERGRVHAADLYTNELNPYAPHES